MKRIKTAAMLLFSAAAVVGCLSVISNRGALTPEKPTALFNGKNLDGWYTFLNGKGRDNDPGKVFKVEDGLLKISGREYGSITTEEEYRDYHLVVEYRFTGWVDEERKAKKIPPDSGILFHSTGPDGAFYGTWMASLEANLLYPGAGDFWTVAPKDRTDITLTCRVGGKREHSWSPYRYSPKSKETVTLTGNKQVIRQGGAKEFKYPEWNVCELICDGDKAKVILNGRTINVAEKVTPSAGRIQIQSEGSEVEFRKIEIRPIKRESKYYIAKANEIWRKHIQRSTGLPFGSGAEVFGYLDGIIADRERLMLTDKDVAILWADYALRAQALHLDDRFEKAAKAALKLDPEIVRSEMFGARIMPHLRLLDDIKTFPKKESEINFGQTLKSMGVKERKTVHLKDHWNKTNMTAVIQGFVNDTNVTTIVVDKMPSPCFVKSIRFNHKVNGKRILIKSGAVVQRHPEALNHLIPKRIGAIFEITGAKNIIIESDAARPEDAVVTFYDSREARLKVNRREGDSCVNIGGSSGSRVDCTSNVVIRNVHLRDSEQDGIGIGALWRPPEEIYVEDVIMDSNFRQGTSPCSYYSIYFKGCRFVNTFGGPPSAGCDVEPWADYLCTGNIYFFDCEFANNAGAALEFATSTKNPILCYVKNSRFRQAPSAQLSITARPSGYIAAGRRPYSDITFEDCLFESLTSSIVFCPCPIYDVKFRNCTIRDARSIARKAASKRDPAPISLVLNRDFGAEFPKELKADVSFENVKIEGFEKADPLGVIDESGMFSVRGVFRGVVDWNGRKVDLSTVKYEAPDLDEPKTAYVDLKTLVKPAKIPAADEAMEESNAKLFYLGAWWLDPPRHSYYFYAEKGREVSFDFDIHFPHYYNKFPTFALNMIGPSGEAVKFADVTKGKARLSYKVRESGWHRLSPGEDVLAKCRAAHYYVSAIKGAVFSWQADTHSDCFAKFTLKDPKKDYTGYFEVPAGGKECRIRLNFGGLELYDPAGNLVDKVRDGEYPGRYIFKIKPSTDKAEIWSFRTPCTPSGGYTRGFRFFAPLNGIWADSKESLPCVYKEHYVPAKKPAAEGADSAIRIDRSILSAKEAALLDKALAERKKFAADKANTKLVKALQAQIDKMSEGKRDDDTEKQLSDLRGGLELVKRAAQMEALAAKEDAVTAEAAAFVMAFRHVLGVDMTAFGLAFPKDTVEYEYPSDMNATITAITAVMKTGNK